MKSGNLNFLEHSGPLQACNGTALPLPLPYKAFVGRKRTVRIDETAQSGDFSNTCKICKITSRTERNTKKQHY